MKALPLLALLALAFGCAQLSPRPAPDTLAGTSWQLVKFQGGDGTVRAPDEKSKYTLAFGTDGSFNVRFDCNRGRGGWKSAGKGQLEFGAMALTRAMCPPGSLHDQLVKHWPYVRSYVIRGGHLRLSLMADGGIYEFEPARR
jgi:para-nitrobenzyl esterase